MAASIWTLGAILRSTAWSPLRTSKVRFGAYAVFTFTAVSGRHPSPVSGDVQRACRSLLSADRHDPWSLSAVSHPLNSSPPAHLLLKVMPT
jgi:hypothetical protein